MPAFDLIQEPWLTCTTLREGQQQFGLYDLLARAGEIKEVAEPSPLVTFGAFRLLVAVVHWLSPVKSVSDWRARWKDGSFPQSLLDDLRSRGSGRFDLFDPMRPFYQHPGTSGKQKPVTVGYLALHLPSGTEISHFSHVYDHQHAFCPACCAKGLITLSPFAPALTWCYPASINGAPPLYVLPCGDSLFQTIMLNVPIEELTPACPNDVPAWERGKRDATDVREGAVGFLEGLTWQPRRAHLLPTEATQECTCCGRESSVVVRQILLHRGGDSRGRPWTDPHVPVRSEGGGPLLPSMACDFWHRAAHALLPGGEPSSIQPPPALDNMRHLARHGLLPRSLLLTVLQTGLQVPPRQQGKTVRWMREAFRLPASLLSDDEACMILREELAGVATVAKRVAKELSKKQGKRSRRDAANARKEAQQFLRHFQAIAKSAFSESLDRISGDRASMRETVTRFRSAVQDAARTAFASVRLQRPLPQRWLRAAKRSRFERDLDTILEKGDER